MVLGTHGAAARGMPLNATEYDGPVDFIGSISDIAAEIVRRIAMRAVKGSLRTRKTGRASPALP